MTKKFNHFIANISVVLWVCLVGKQVLSCSLPDVFVRAFLCVDVCCKLSTACFKLYSEKALGSFQRLPNGKYSFTTDFILPSTFFVPPLKILF